MGAKGSEDKEETAPDARCAATEKVSRCLLLPELIAFDEWIAAG